MFSKRVLAGGVGIGALMLLGACHNGDRADHNGYTGTRGQVSGNSSNTGDMPDTGSSTDPRQQAPAGGGADTWRPSDRDRPSHPYGSDYPGGR